ncbi:ferredoxin [Saccharospirillum sp.]|uniref:ferredoxin n=1 Tax=Saccharospirillum sp. TaxID=2033801 RepID=UPI0034A031C5
MSKSITICFELSDGSRKEVEAELGQSVMQTAIFNNVEGIDAECGGSCMCATCHVYSNDSNALILPEIEEEEEEMLSETAAERKPFSRLSCQLLVTEELDGAVFQIPEVQS